MQAPYKIISLLFFLVVSLSSYAQEICNNGIDDDGDSLVDLKDPDCQCHFTVADNLLLNGSFESYDHCPVTYVYTTDHNIASAWEYGTYTNVNEAYFYHNMLCTYDASVIMSHMPPLQPLPDGNAFISIFKNAYNDGRNEADMAKGYVSQCLQAPLKAGEDYTLSFYAGRFVSWDDSIAKKIYPFTVAVFGNADCNAVPFGKVHAFGNGCPLNYPGWVLLGETTINSYGQWIQSKVKLTIPSEINVIEIGADCSILPPIIDQADSTTYLDYHVYYLDDLHLLPTKNFPFEYIQIKTGSSCKGLPVLQAPVFANATYQWYKDSIAIKRATANLYAVTDTAGISYYNVQITTDTNCIISEPFLVAASKLNEIHITTDTVLCANTTITLAPALLGITYNINGVTNTVVSINKPGIYNITATDVYGCQRTFKINIAEQNCSVCDALLPTAFTPNNDGLNDVFKAKLRCYFSEFDCKIFNRWGQQIFESSDINKGWDGNYMGNKMQPGTYVYFISYKTADKKIKTAKGMIALIR